MLVTHVFSSMMQFCWLPRKRGIVFSSCFGGQVLNWTNAWLLPLFSSATDSRIMPTDTKRVRGPDVSQSPSLFVCKPADVLPTHGPRPDGRQRDQVDVRPVFVRCGLVSQAKGSAYIEAGNTKLMCCVYGPRETERKDETDMKCGRYAMF